MDPLKQFAAVGACLAIGSVAFAQVASESVAPSPVVAKDPAPAADKDAKPVRVQYEHRVKEREFSAFYANLSQARLTLGVQKRFDPEIAKVRDYFICQLTGAGITDAFVFDADDEAYRANLIGILGRFHSESLKSADLGKRMSELKKTLGGTLSQTETKLVELKAKPDADKTAVAAIEAEIATLQEKLSVADEVSKMKSLSGEMGVSRIGMNHPPYSFVATFEPEKQLYIMRAGYSVQISSKDAEYYMDLLKRVPEVRQRLLDGETKDVRLRAEVKAIFEAEKK